MTATAGTVLEELDSPVEVLRVAREARAAAMHADAVLLTAAVTWAEQHPPESIDEAATWITAAGDTGLSIAGPGAPLVAEFCIAEFALAIGRSTDAGRAVIAAAVELKYRLPRCWTRVQSGDLEAWRARRIAEATFVLARESAAFVDAQVAPFAHRIGIAALERLIAEAIARFMPDQAAADARQAADGRHLTIEHQQVSFNGTSQIHGELDLADALDLDAAVSQGAEALKTLGSTESLGVRRSLAAGQIARNQLALDLSSGSDAGTVTTGWSSSERSERTDETPPPNNSRRPKPRQVVLHLHLSQAAITGTGNCLELARVENQRRVVTADQIRTWCANPDTQVVVKPVVDLNEHIHVEGYEVPERLREQAMLRDHSCVFPWCARSARKADADHVIPYADGGTTSSDNIAPLCRRHHRLKTHSAWTYTMLEPGSYLWSSPHGYQFLRDHHGTLDVSGDRRRPTADPPDHSLHRPVPRRASPGGGTGMCTPHRTWSRLSARFARCSTTCGSGRFRRTDVVSRRSLRSLLNHRGAACGCRSRLIARFARC